jgi:tetratricopeptide (TPR) repeat protein
MPKMAKIGQNRNFSVRASLEVRMAFLRGVDRRLILSGVLAIIMAAILLALTVNGPQEGRFWSAVGLIALLTLVQVFLLFVRPEDRTPFGQARTAFTNGDYQTAISLLESQIKASPRPDARRYILLANSHRHVGNLSEAYTTAEKALSLRPNDAYARYAMGRVLLAKGAYDAAAGWFDQALAMGAPANVACDLGWAEYFDQNVEAAEKTLLKTTKILRLEPFRLYMTNAILYVLLYERLPTDHPSLTAILRNLAQSTESGRTYWETEHARFPDSDYGQQIRKLLDAVYQLPIPAESPMTLTR